MRNCHGQSRAGSTAGVAKRRLGPRLAPEFFEFIEMDRKAPRFRANLSSGERVAGGPLATPASAALASSGSATYHEEVEL